MSRSISIIPGRVVLFLVASALLIVVAGQMAVAGQEPDPPGISHKLEYPDDPDQVRERIAGYEIVNRDVSLDLIIGSDERRQVHNTRQFPYSAVTYIEAWDDAEDIAVRCSASFVGENVLLTAAHCLWVPEFRNGWPDGLVVVPGLDGETEPFGHQFAAELWVPDAWIDAEGEINSGHRSDYALITLSDSSMSDQTGTFTVGVLPDEELNTPNFNPTTAGYPGDKAFGTQWEGSDLTFKRVNETHLVHEIDAFQGQSGSAVWRATDRLVVGIVSFETSRENYARRLTGDVMSELNAACDALGCEIQSAGNTGSGGTPSTPAPSPTPTASPTETVTPSPTATETETPTSTPGTTPEPPPPPIAGDTSAFDRVWARTDLPVESGVASRTWMWGPPASGIFMERYDDSPDGHRTVRYHEKSRMEISSPDSNPDSLWYVTNGLLAKELVTGRLQVGESEFVTHTPAGINLAGDLNDPNGPTYATFSALLDAPPLDRGTPVTQTIDPSGSVSTDQALADFGVTAAQHVPETNHTVASVFWEFLHSEGTVYEDGEFAVAGLFVNPFYATGFPISEPYWTTVNVGGEPTLVLVQVFERRVLTYTPGNPAGWQVEAGNVGLHYQQWRYEMLR